MLKYKKSDGTWVDLNNAMGIIDSEPSSGSKHPVTADGIQKALDKKSLVSVSSTGTATDEVQYITIDGVEKKLAGGGSSDVKAMTLNGGWNSSSVTGDNYSCLCYGKDKFVAISTGSTPVISYSSDGITWTDVTPPSSIDLTKVTDLCYGNNVFIATLSENTNCLYSTDGITWTTKQISETSGTWSHICFGNNYFFTIDTNYTWDSESKICSFRYAYSTDGVSWAIGTNLPTIEDPNYPYKLCCYGNDKFIVSFVNGSTYKIVYTTDFSSWTTVSEDIPSSINDWQELYYANGKFIGVPFNSYISGTYIYKVDYSEDGIKWSEAQIGTKDGEFGKGVSITYFSLYGKYIIITQDNYKYAYSSDGINWTISSMPSGYWAKVRFGLYANKVVACGQFVGNVNAYLTQIGYTITQSSKDVTSDVKTTVGGSNVSVSSTGSSTNFIKYITVDNVESKLPEVIVSDEGTATDTVSYITVNGVEKKLAGGGSSSDGLKYNSKFSTTPETSTIIDDGGSYTWNSVCYGNGKYVAVANNNGIAYSSDGIEWITVGTLPSGSWYFKKVCYGNGIFVAFSAVRSGSYDDTFTSLYSTDGIEWLKGSEICTYSNYYETMHAFYGFNKFYFITVFGEIYTSSNGSSWTSGGSLPDMTSGTGFYGASYGNNIAVVFPNDTTHYCDYTTDGITWTKGDVYSTPSGYLEISCYGKDKFFAIRTDSNLVFTSSDGKTWTQNTNTLTSSVNWTDICYGNGKYIVIGSNGLLNYSSDGDTWTEVSLVTSSLNYNWKSICYGTDKFVAVNTDNNTSIYIENYTNLVQDSKDVTSDVRSLLVSNTTISNATLSSATLTNSVVQGALNSTPITVTENTTIDVNSNDIIIVDGKYSVTVNNGDGSKGWCKIVVLTNAEATVSFADETSWTWASGSAPTISAGCEFVFTWNGYNGKANFLK